MVNEVEQRLWRAKEGLENAVARIAVPHEVHPDYGDTKNERRRKAETEWIEAIVRRVSAERFANPPARQAVVLAPKPDAASLVDQVHAALADGKMQKGAIAAKLGVAPEAVDEVLTEANGFVKSGAWWGRAETVNA